MKNTWFKFAILWSAVFLFRLIPWRAPNVEPMLATIMPFSKRSNVTSSFLFGFLGIVVYDAFTSGFGEWTWITAFSYGALGAVSYVYFRTREATRGNFLLFGVVGTLTYDALTGLTIGPFFHGQNFMLAFMGQIPFTLMHLAGVIVFSTLLSPIIYRYVIEDESFGLSPLWKDVLANN